MSNKLIRKLKKFASDNSLPFTGEGRNVDDDAYCLALSSRLYYIDVEIGDDDQVFWSARIRDESVTIWESTKDNLKNDFLKAVKLVT